MDSERHIPSSDDEVRRAAASFARPSPWRSCLQLVTSFGPFLAGCAAMYLAYPLSPWLTLALSLPTGALLVRVFIVQHDCGHGSFFASRGANTPGRAGVQPDHAHALRQLGPPAQRPSRQLEQPRPAHDRQRHLFGLPDGARIPGADAVAALLSTACRAIR